ncbi:hypothetical protein STEG23_027366, partial [Scotinomys teguina]
MPLRPYKVIRTGHLTGKYDSIILGESSIWERPRSSIQQIQNDPLEELRLFSVCVKDPPHLLISTSSSSLENKWGSLEKESQSK